MPKTDRLLSVSPLAVGAVVVPLVWAMTADGLAAAITVVGLAALFVIDRGFKQLSPHVLGFVSGMKKIDRQLEDQSAEIAKVRREAEEAKERSELMEKENGILRDNLFQMLVRHQANLDSDVSAIGEVVLIQAGDMIDPTKKGKSS